MKYILLVVSVILIFYPLYAIISCIRSFNSLTNYGYGVLTGGIILLITGCLSMYFTIKLFKQKRKQ